MAVGWKSLAGIVGAASVVSVGTLYSVLVREPAGQAPSPAVAPAMSEIKPAGNTPATPKPATDKATTDKPDTTKVAAANPAAGGTTAAKPEPAKSDQAKLEPPKPEAAKPEPVKPEPVKPDAAKPDVQLVPTFDVARVEPAGNAVIAGRSAPGATVELLRNGTIYARVVADLAGQWAIVPPALPKGPCELTLRTTSPDGKVIKLSEQTISVRVPEKPDEEVVVVLNTPDQPSKILTDAARPASKVAEQTGSPQPAGTAAPADAAKSPSRANTSIRTVEADEMGRFFVTGRAEPGATLRIYLNDTLVTSVTAAKDGTFGMTIEKGMLPGNYRVRVDDVSAGNGQVLTRAEVPFAMVDKAPSSSAPAVVAAIATPSRSPATRSDQPAGTPPQSGTMPSRGAPGSATPSQPQPASVHAPGAAPSSDVPATTPLTPGDNTQPVATAELVQGSSPGSKPAATPSASNPATPQTSPVATSEAKPAQPSPPPSMAVIPEIRTTTIAQGDNLWRISRKVYGQGIRYTWIYDANTDQIRNPNLIYPGQIFVMPDKKNP